MKLIVLIVFAFLQFLPHVIPFQTKLLHKLPRIQHSHQRAHCTKATQDAKQVLPRTNDARAKPVLNPIYTNGAIGIVGVAIGATVMFSKQCVSFLDANLLTKFPLYTPILGGTLIGTLNLLEEKLSQSSFSKLSLQETPNISWKRFLLRYAGFLIAIGTGLSVGIAGPAAEIGMVIAFVACQRLFAGQLPLPDLIPLILAGAGAGLAANFNAPLSGALYSLEVSNQLVAESDQTAIANDKRKTYLLLAVVMAVLYVRKQSFFAATNPLLKTNFQFGRNIVAEFLSLIGLGISSGLLYNLYAQLRTVFQRQYATFPLPMRPVIAGIFCGIAALLGYPQSLSNGFATVNTIASGGVYSVQSLFSFLLWKVCLVASSSVANIPGGQLAPLLFIGAAAGALFAHIFQTLFPSVMGTVPIAACALIGATSLLAVNFKSILFPLVLMLELTKSVELVIAGAFSAIVAREFNNLWEQRKQKTN